MSKPKIAELERLLKRTDEYVPLIIVMELAPLLRLARAAKDGEERWRDGVKNHGCKTNVTTQYAMNQLRAALDAFDWSEE